MASEPIDLMAAKLALLEKRLQAAQTRRAEAGRAFTFKGGGDELRSASDALYAAERDLAAFKQEEHAVPLDFPVRWDIGAPMPQLLMTERRALLTFLLREIDPNWDGSYVTMKRHSSEEAESVALVQCTAATPPSWDRRTTKCFTAIHSRARESTVIRRSSFATRGGSPSSSESTASIAISPRGWATLNHYVFWFHD